MATMNPARSAVRASAAVAAAVCSALALAAPHSEGEAEARRASWHYAVYAGTDRAEPRWEFVWADEFDGATLDASKWNIQLGDGTAEGIPGWGNNELQHYQAGNVALADGELILTARAERAGGRNYTSGRINTNGKFMVRYGRIEGRIRAPAGQGLWAAFWMLPTGSPYGGWSASGEIDIMEVFSRQPAPFTQAAAHYGMAWPLNAHTYQRYDGIDPADGFHVHALEWDARELRWFVDGAHFFTVPNATYWNYYKNAATNAFESGLASAPFDQPFHLLLNLAVGGDLPGDPVPQAFPGEMRVDYVRVYRCTADGDEGVGCAGIAAPIDPAVQPTGAEDVYQAEYPLYRDAVGPLALAGADSEEAVPLAMRVDDAGGALMLAEVSEGDERGQVLELASTGGGSFAIQAEDGSSFRLFGMGPVEGADLAGEIQFDALLVAAGTEPDSRLRLKVDSALGEAGSVELAVADLPTTEWITITVQIGDLVRNAEAGALNLDRIRSLFVLEPVGAVRLRLDALRIRCGHKFPQGCGIAR